MSASRLVPPLLTTVWSVSMPWLPSVLYRICNASKAQGKAVESLAVRNAAVCHGTRARAPNNENFHLDSRHADIRVFIQKCAMSGVFKFLG